MRGVNVGENDLRADLMDGFRRGNVGEGRGDHFIAGTDVERAQGEREGVGAGVHAHAELGPGISRQLLLEGGDIRAEDVVTAGQRLLHGGQQFGFQRLVLRLEIEKRNVHVRAD